MQTTSQAWRHQETREGWGWWGYAATWMPLSVVMTSDARGTRVGAEVGMRKGFRWRADPGLSTHANFDSYLHNFTCSLRNLYPHSFGSDIQRRQLGWSAKEEWDSTASLEETGCLTHRWNSSSHWQGLLID